MAFLQFFMQNSAFAFILFPLLHSGFLFADTPLRLPVLETLSQPGREPHLGDRVIVLSQDGTLWQRVDGVPYNCLRGNLVRDNKHLYQWTAIDECTRIRFVYGFEEHTPENSVKFLRMLVKVFPFKIQTVQTDNGTEFTYKYISDTEECPFDKALRELGIAHKLIPPRTPWHNGKVERSHRNDQRYFYDWETFRSLEDFNKKLAEHLIWSNNKPMRTLKDKSPRELLSEKLAKK